MKMFKKFLSAALALTLTLSLAACGGNGGESAAGNADNAAAGPAHRGRRL